MKATRTSRQIVKYFLADLRPLRSRKAEEAVADRVRIIKHEAVAKCGSCEVRFSDGRPSKYFYWEGVAGRRRPARGCLPGQPVAATKEIANGLHDRLRHAEQP